MFFFWQGVFTKHPTCASSVFMLSYVGTKLASDLYIKQVISASTALSTKIYSKTQGMLWNGMENGMEWKENFGMEYGSCLEWSGMEDRLPYFHTNFICNIQTHNKLQINAIDTS